MKNKFNKKKLQCYSALASTFLLAQKADAQIIYTDVNPDVVLGASHPGYWEYFLDLNNDGNYDYEFTQRNHNGIVASQRMYGLYSESFFNSYAEFAQIPGAHSFPQPVASGFIIPDNLQANQWNTFGYFLTTYSSGDFTTHESAFTDKYIPLKLHVNGDNYYGWVRMTYTGSRLFIKDCALNTTPNESIAAGDKGDNVVCIDNMEPNNSKSIAQKLSSSAEAHGLIDPAGDVDWFRFKVIGGSPNKRIMLRDLPANYNLRLFNSAGVQIGTSNNTGSTNDTIQMNDMVSGDYYIKVVGANGAFDPSQCYTLYIQEGGPFKEVSPPDVKDEITVFPNPAHGKIIIEGLNLTDENQTIGLLDVFGRQIKTFVVPAQASTINIEFDGLTGGIYFLRVEMNDGIVLKKIIVE